MARGWAVADPAAVSVSDLGLKALEEAVNFGGLHRFTTMPAFAAVSELAAWCDPFETPEPVRPRDQAVGERDIADAVAAMDEPRVVTVVAVVSARGERQVERYLSVYAGADRLVLGSPEDSGVRLTDVARPALAERLTTTVE